MDSKDRLRRKMTARRKALTATELKSASDAVCGHILDMPEWRDAETVLMYMSVSNEVDVSGLIEKALGHKTIALPVCEEDCMYAALYSGGVLDIGRYNIPEPKEKQKLDNIDLAIIPGVAFDSLGMRLGHGGGYYDRFLASAGVRFKLGVAYDFQVVEKLYVETHDIAMDAIVSERGIIRITKQE